MVHSGGPGEKKYFPPKKFCTFSTPVRLLEKMEPPKFANLLIWMRGFQKYRLRLNRTDIGFWCRHGLARGWWVFNDFRFPRVSGFGFFDSRLLAGFGFWVSSRKMPGFLGFGARVRVWFPPLPKPYSKFAHLAMRTSSDRASYKRFQAVRAGRTESNFADHEADWSAHAMGSGIRHFESTGIGSGFRKGRIEFRYLKTVYKFPEIRGRRRQTFLKQWRPLVHKKRR